MVAFPVVPIPGLREAIKKERFLRDAAFLDSNELLLGLEVVPLSLRRMIWLEQAHNGFICPWKWESDDELLGHAIALLYFSQPDFRPPAIRRSFLTMWRETMREHRFTLQLLSKHTPEAIVEAVDGWVSEALMDAPVGDSGSNISGASYASWPAYIFDKFGEAGLTYTPDQILDMGLKRLWQHYRIATARLDGAKLTNPSDELATTYLAKNPPKLS